MADSEGHVRPEFASPSSSQKQPIDEQKWKKTVAKEKPNLGKQNICAYTGEEVSEHAVWQ